MKYFKSRALIVLIVSLVLIVTIGLTINPLSSVTYAGQEIEAGVGLFNNVEVLRAENKALKEEIDRLNNERTEYVRLKTENDDLKNVLKLKDQLDGIDMAGANVIAKDSGNLFNIFLVDKGVTNGISYNMPVVTSKGLVGKVSSSQPFSSKITSIIEDGSAASAIVAKSGDLVVVKGDLKLGKEGLCKLLYIPNDLDLTQGDVIETSGLGGIYPKGIIIGTVKEVRTGESDLDRYAIIQPAVDLRRLSQVVILKKNMPAISSEMEITDK